MNNLVFATNNSHKVAEVKNMLQGKFDIFTLEEVDIHEDIPETGTTFHANALQKCHFVYNGLGLDCFADDSGLEVDALNGAPGVYSARYAGSRDMAKNIALLLANMEHQSHKKAAFKTVIALIWNGKEYFFEGKIEGKLTREKRGASGFGYDPIFIPNGHEQTFAEMAPEQKNAISHRSIAVTKLVEFLLSR